MPTVKELKKIAAENNIKIKSGMKKSEIKHSIATYTLKLGVCGYSRKKSRKARRKKSRKARRKKSRKARRKKSRKARHKKSRKARRKPTVKRLSSHGNKSPKMKKKSRKKSRKKMKNSKTEKNYKFKNGKRGRGGGSVHDNKRQRMGVQLKCDDIDWLVDVFGSSNIITGLTGIAPRNTTRRGRENEQGLYFDGAHWHAKCCIDSPKIDSYSKCHQIKGTAHFCQSFALIYYIQANAGNFSETNLNEIASKLKDGEYSNNVKVAMWWWKEAIGTIHGLGDMLISEINDIGREREAEVTYSKDLDKNGLFNDKLGKRLATYNHRDLIRFLNGVEANSDKLYNCKEG